MEDLDAKVVGNKEILYEVADTLHNMGCAIADFKSGKRIVQPLPTTLGQYNTMGILVPSNLELFGIPIPFIKRMAYPADLWIDNRTRNAIPDERWVLDVYGSENVDDARNFMQKIADPFNVEVIAKVYIDQFRWVNQEIYFPGLDI